MKILFTNKNVHSKVWGITLDALRAKKVHPAMISSCTILPDVEAVYHLIKI